MTKKKEVTEKCKAIIIKRDDFGGKGKISWNISVCEIEQTGESKKILTVGQFSLGGVPIDQLMNTIVTASLFIPPKMKDKS